LQFDFNWNKNATYQGAHWFNGHLCHKWSGVVPFFIQGLQLRFAVGCDSMFVDQASSACRISTRSSLPVRLFGDYPLPSIVALQARLLVMTIL